MGKRRHQVKARRRRPRVTLKQARAIVAARRARAARAEHGSDFVHVDALTMARKRATVMKGGRVRARTVSGRLRRNEQHLRDRLDAEALEYDRPINRDACMQMQRPCPFVSCSHHLYLDVNQETGAIKLNFPHLEVWEMAETCSLDVADRGGITLEEVGAILNLTRERIRQVEVRGLAKIKGYTGAELGVPPDRG